MALSLASKEVRTGPSALDVAKDVVGRAHSINPITAMLAGIGTIMGNMATPQNRMASAAASQALGEIPYIAGPAVNAAIHKWVPRIAGEMIEASAGNALMGEAIQTYFDGLGYQDVVNIQNALERGANRGID